MLHMFLFCLVLLLVRAGCSSEIFINKNSKYMWDEKLKIIYLYTLETFLVIDYLVVAQVWELVLRNSKQNLRNHIFSKLSDLYRKLSFSYAAT